MDNACSKCRLDGCGRGRTVVRGRGRANGPFPFPQDDSSGNSRSVQDVPSTEESTAPPKGVAAARARRKRHKTFTHSSRPSSVVLPCTPHARMQFSLASALALALGSQFHHVPHEID